MHAVQLSSRSAMTPRARIGGPKIVEGLRKQGAQVSDIALYDTVTAVPDAAALAALAENMPGGSAIRPGDVLTSMSGKTIEIKSV